MKCDECNNANICLDHIEFPSLGGCTSGMPDRKVITNADRIRNMSDEELVELITKLNKECLAGIGECDCGAHKTCTNCNVEVRKWLQSEAKVEESEEK